MADGPDMTVETFIKEADRILAQKHINHIHVDQLLWRFARLAYERSTEPCIRRTAAKLFTIHQVQEIRAQEALERVRKEVEEYEHSQDDG